MIVVSPYGLVDLPQENIRVLEQFIDMSLIDETIGFGAVKQVHAIAGKTHQVRSEKPIVSGWDGFVLGFEPIDIMADCFLA